MSKGEPKKIDLEQIRMDYFGESEAGLYRAGVLLMAHLVSCLTTPQTQEAQIELAVRAGVWSAAAIQRAGEQ